MKTIALALILVTGAISAHAGARDVAGVPVPDTVVLQHNELALAGAGVRSKFFMKIYVGALYVTNPKELSADTVLRQPGPKSVRLHFLYKALSPEQLVDAWNDGFNGNNAPEQLAALRARIDLFNAMFPAVKRGDQIQLNLLDTGRTEVWVNDQMRGAISGADFQQALLKIWLGDNPADKGLKDAMLGK